MRTNAKFIEAGAVAVLTVLPFLTQAEHGRAEGYRQTNLVSDQAGVAMLQDPNLVNAWGISFGPSTPFWVSDNATSLSTLYAVTNDPAGMPHVSKRSLEVMIPGEGNPSGQVFNGTGAFNKDLFIFVSEDGTISGWRPALGPAAETLARHDSAVYKGVALAADSLGPVLLAANFREATLDMYDGSMNLVGQFQDHHAPMGYAPFNVQNLRGMVFVTFAKQDADKHDDVPGAGNGLIDVFNPLDGKFHPFVTGRGAGGKSREINSPWGLAIAPEGFGEHANELLVGNFGSGTIMAFDAEGKFRGLLKSMNDHPIIIDGLWGLTFGNGGAGGSADILYFSAGPNAETHGLFGSLQPVQKHRREHDED